MAEAVAAEAETLLPGLPDAVVVWEILVRLPPKYLLRCRAVRRAWRAVTSARDFLLAHHGRQPILPIFSGDDERILGVRYHTILAFDHRAATEDDQLHAVARLHVAFQSVAACDGLLVLSKLGSAGSCLSICNPATREHALLGLPSDFRVMGMYLHRPTAEYRLLLLRKRCQAGDLVHKLGCYVFSLGSGQPPRYIGGPEIASGNFSVPVRVRDRLHWYPVYCLTERNPWHYESQLLVFDTIAESFLQMRELMVDGYSYIFDMDGMLGIYTRNLSTKAVEIRVLPSYETEVWDFKYQIKLPVAKIRRAFQDCGDYGNWDLDVVSVDGGVLLLVKLPQWLLHVDSNGKMVNSIYKGQRCLSMTGRHLKQSLVQHTFFPALEGYAVNASPFIGPVE
ncbi:putative F-box protein At3g23260 [Lolium perenne]|uniref:putative F-box protein At3g23260 n=1 Tax=Lolium perenne TaxID=4522 RepID=UPI0021EB4A6B